MCCEQVVCASCARPVADASCPVCRAARAELHGAQPVPYAVVAAAAVLLLALVLLVSGRVA